MARLAAARKLSVIIVAVDDRDNAAALAATMRAAGLSLRVVIEVNMGIDRAGVEPGVPAARWRDRSQARRACDLWGSWGGRATPRLA